MLLLCVVRVTVILRLFSVTSNAQDLDYCVCSLSAKHYAFGQTPLLGHEQLGPERLGPELRFAPSG
jgi:hypothetical protein